MSLKKQLFDAVKRSTSGFDETKDSFLLKFEGGGDSFGSFTHFEVTVDDVPDAESDFEPSEHYELIMNIMDNSGVKYTFLNYGSECKINYHNGVLIIETKSPLSFDDSDYSKAWQNLFDDEDEARDAYYDNMEYSRDSVELSE